ncbi:MAG: restriction endonuclease subunit S [Hafnia sp.]
MNGTVEMQAEKIIPKGYKLTEAGVIPQDWDVRKIGDIAEVIRGASPRPKGDKRFYGGNIPRLMVEDVTRDGKYVTPSVDSLTEAGAKLSRPCDKGTLTLVCSGTVGIPSILAVNACIHDGFLGLTKVKKSVSIDYLYHFFTTQQEKFNNSATHGGVFTNLTTDGVKEFLLALPRNKNEQIAIANFLSDTDTFITELEQIIIKKQSIKTATMQQLLTGRTRLTQFAQYPNGTTKNYKSSELGLIPEDWEVARLAQVAKVIDPHPSHRAPPEESYGVPFVGIGDLNESGELINSEVRRVNQSILQEHSERYTLHNQPIGLGRVASIGKVIRLRLGKEPYAISPTLGVIDGFACTNDFLFYYLKSESVTEQFSRVMSGSTRSSVGMNVLKEILVVKISNEEQISIAAILSDMDAELKALEQKLAKFRAIKQGMMQQLLTGRIRLPLEQQP